MEYANIKDAQPEESSVQVDMTFCTEAVAVHNQYRERHKAPPLALDTKLCKSAQGWAETLLNMAMLQNSTLANQGEVGENISMRRGSDVVDITGTLLSFLSCLKIICHFVEN